LENVVPSIETYLPKTRIAYLSMEIAIRSEMHTYSGGLGVLAGDTVRSAADLALPMVFVTLVSRQGYLRQEIDEDGRQVDRSDPWDVTEWATPLSPVQAAMIEGRPVWVRPWLYELTSSHGNKVPVLLLDTNVEQNDPQDRTITDWLYGGDNEYRLKQEIVLGIGAERVLLALGFKIETYHLNEGHAALLPLALLRHHPRPENAPAGMLPYDVEAVRKQCVFTTHTPVEAGHDRFAYDDVRRVLGDFVPFDHLKALGGHEHLNMTTLALSLSGFVNGVSLRHAEVTRHMFPGHRIHGITNGVHLGKWTHPSFARLFSEIAPDWEDKPEMLSEIESISDEAIWAAHEGAKRELVDLVRERTGTELDPHLPIISFARRMTSYKRPSLIFSDWARLLDIHQRFPFQIVFSGKAHPRDEGGKAMIREISGQARDARIPVAFVPNYEMEIARTLVAGSDVWLNNPIPPLEASGTSGMKAAINGVLNLSTLDGWWLEGCEEAVTGWGIGQHDNPDDHARALYEKLEGVVLPLYATDRPRWIWMMKQAIGQIGPVFNTRRMMLAYAREAYGLQQLPPT
jgi:starch phosphorylase